MMSSSFWTANAKLVNSLNSSNSVDTGGTCAYEEYHEVFSWIASTDDRDVASGSGNPVSRQVGAVLASLAHRIRHG